MLVLGFGDGISLGNTVGLDVLGSADGKSVGDVLGLLDVDFDGLLVGDILGVTDGVAVGDEEGLKDGRGVGAEVLQELQQEQKISGINPPQSAVMETSPPQSVIVPVNKLSSTNK